MFHVICYSFSNFDVLFLMVNKLIHRTKHFNLAILYSENVLEDFRNQSFACPQFSNTQIAEVIDQLTKNAGGNAELNKVTFNATMMEYHLLRETLDDMTREPPFMCAPWYVTFIASTT